MTYEVGKCYDIKCAVVLRRNGRRLYVPIIGEAHMDKQFSVDYMHYHVDGRFIKNDRGLNYFLDSMGLTNAIVATVPINNLNSDNDIFEKVVIKRRRCYRLTTGIDPPPKAEKYHKWHAEQIGKSCAGKKCPHLGTEMLQFGDKLLCPLHNLIGCGKTEKIINMSIHQLFIDERIIQQ